MKKSFLDVLKLLLPLNREKREFIADIERLTSKDLAKEVKHWLKMGKVKIRKESIGSENIGMEEDYPFVVYDGRDDPDKDFADLIDSWNSKIEKKVEEVVFNNFSIGARNAMKRLLAPNILGLDEVKEAALLQLFAQERVHVLLLGDPGTGKTDILRAAADFSPISSFGLGSGTSGVGLTVTMKGDEVVKGLLPLADGGLCCVDELNLMKEHDRAGLLNAMEKGFVTYDKGNKHIKIDADIKVLATANPKGDRFAGWIVETLKKQLPFDPALLTRFHLVFLIKEPDVKGFKKIAEKIVKEKDIEVTETDKEFIKDYIKHVSKLNVKFDKKLEPYITDFVEDVKKNEKKYLVDVSPRLVVGIMRLCKASARMDMRKKVERKDIARVLTLVEKSLELNKEKE